MFIYLTVFTALVLAVVWILQTVLLDDVYRAIKEAQIKRAAVKISERADSLDFEESVYRTAAEENMCVAVYKISGGVGKAVVNAHSLPFCLIHSSSEESFINSVYSQAKKSGTYTEILPSGSENMADGIICAKIASEKNYELLIVLNSEIQPVGATVTTLRHMFLWISVILLIVSAAASCIIALKITGPVRKMNEEAKKLAQGSYDVNFTGGEFLETSQLAQTLNYAASELSKLDVMQKELIANISHDLRTPLTMISGYSEVMRDIPGEMTGENMQIIIDETARLSSLVNDMLDLSRIAGGERKLNITRFSLTSAVGDTIKRYAQLSERDGYKISFDSCGEVYVDADEILILQVIYNLISNAINYTGEDKTVNVSLNVSDGICRVSVQDTGEGIPQDKIPLIWDRYYKASDFHKRAVCGTGLGLSIVKNALMLHNAPFGVSSTVGVGSTFWFELPAVTENTPPDA